ncbi:5-oxoprolinase subunit PxpA [Nocardioides jejuensis]|uniref:LamB/YcsF family protein n=1 Tax=Nocardioides jejuensis TaxID=2502782 RepID=A0A4R1CHZ0_9ACTN|nr:5-oxoprolinase subunit PxpA [Nocardioides jejuensis]TCJ30920.1 LamB/YcsF family protein [Nocardioides jejuensis]
MTRVIDLNADLGEEITDDAALLAVVTSANVACGFHAGTPETMRFVCDRAAELGVAIGAQVSYLDRENFGRLRTDVAADVLAAQVAEQVGLLMSIARSSGVAVTYVKPHGALYNRVVDDVEQASAVLAGSGDLPVLGLPGGVLLEMAALGNRQVWREGFPDRGYTAEGRLVPRDQPGALVHEVADVAANAVRLAQNVDSVCVHGDSASAVSAAVAVRAALEGAGWTLEPFTR